MGGAPAGGSGGTLGTGGTPPLSCSTGWETAEEVEMLRLSEGIVLASITVSPDELELFYAFQEAQDPWSFRHATRASKSEPFGSILPEPTLDEACAPDQQRNIDLSGDGLTAYIACYADVIDYIEGDLHLARRASLGASFAVDPMPYGMVGVSPSIGPGELELYTSGIGPADSPEPPRRYSRASTATAFSTFETLSGVGTGIFTAPDAAPDGLTLFGHYGGTGLLMATRPSRTGSFGAASVIRPVTADGGLSYGSAEVSADCQTLYYVKINTMAEPLGWHVYALRK